MAAEGGGEMSRYIDADALLLKIDLHGTNKFGMLDEDIREFIRSIPTADAAEVLRCKDCKFFCRGNKCYCEESPRMIFAAEEKGMTTKHEICTDKHPPEVVRTDSIG